AAAASELTRARHPWLVGGIDWTPAITRRAVVWLARAVDKPVLKLLDEHYSEHGMADLLTEQGPAYGLNIRIFNELQHTITGWPGGKPDADDRHRPERAAPHPKRVVVFSPEPSDDVLGMGGTLRRLVEQGHEVSIVYQTSGSLAVPDEEAAMATELMLELSRRDDPEKDPGLAIARQVRRQLETKAAFDADPAEVRQLKGFIRRNEARAALKVSGIDPARAHFLDLPFYEQGRYRQFRLGDADVGIVARLLEHIRPHQIFATGSLDDPASVAAICFEAVRRAIASLAGKAWMADCRTWLYRGPDKTWGIAEIEMAVPLSPDELATKIRAIYHHKSQRSQSPVEAGRSEAWQQADHRNRETARLYDQLGLAEYEAIEAFQRGDAS
ncbi:MAG TPA: PIG-L family deacetylase, partial [Opitutus sp.]|nr:PIG-L family deacetylase [Opitutus sp.]